MNPSSICHLSNAIYLFHLILLYNVNECLASISSSSVYMKDEGKSHGRPLTWLQQHWPNLFGHHHSANTGTHQGKKSKNKHSSSSSKPGHEDPARRRLIYYDALGKHFPMVWTETNQSGTFYDMFSRFSSNSFPVFPPSMRESALEKIREMFYHAYDGYYWNAWPNGELLPGSCTGTNFSLVKLPALTAIDALDTFWILGNTTELVRNVERLRNLKQTLGTSLWDVDENISVFETTIRVLGGLLSAHQILLDELHIWQHEIWDPVTGMVLDGRSVLPSPTAQDPIGSCPAPPPLLCQDGLEKKEALSGEPTSPCSCDVKNSTRHSATTTNYKYDGFLLDLATDIADRMVPAFDTKTGIPYGTVNLRAGVPIGETTVASLAGAGTLVLEWELLSRLTGNPLYGQLARRAARGLWMRQSDLHLVGKHIDTRTGTWVESLSGIGSNSDSFIEYLVKYCFVFLDGKGADNDFRSLWPAIYQGVFKHMRRGDWYADTDYQTPASGRAVFESLMAFYPGLQIWLGELAPAARSLNAFFLVREHLGFLPERFSHTHWRADSPKYPLRPELFESNYFMHRAVQSVPVTSPFTNRTSHSGWLWAAFWSVQKLAQLRTKCGYASLHNVDPESTGLIGDVSGEWKAEDDMPSFFLSETLKYLFLTFDEDNPLHADDNRQWMFTTEAHPVYLPTADMDENITSDLYQLEEILVRVSQGKRQKKITPNTSDVWAPDTTFKDFLTRLFPIELEMKREQINRPHEAFFFRDRHLLETVGAATTTRHDGWDETDTFENLAHIRFSTLGVGAGFSLRSACPNYYASDLLWIHALHGDSLDFMEGFLSKKDNHGRKADTLQSYGSVEALGFYGMAYNPGQRGQGHGCPIRAVASVRSPKQEAKSKESEDVAEFVSDVGTFQIIAFPDGNGFSVFRKDDGQTLTVSFMRTSDDGTEGTGYLTLLSENMQSEGPSTQSIMADFSGNSYFCEVMLVQVPLDGPIDQGGDPMVKVPCTPGMFGPAHMDNIVSNGGATIQAPIYPPLLTDPTGCQVPARDEGIKTWTPEGPLDFVGGMGQPECPNNNIQIVSRGICSFMTKALNQKNGRGADAVIVMNTNDELFTMAGDPDFDPLDSDGTPLSVMVSKSDGTKLLNGITMLRSEESRLVGRVSIEAQAPAEALESIVANGAPLRLPYIHTTDSLIQVYAEGHWGVQALATDSNWNLQLIRHQLG